VILRGGPSLEDKLKDLDKIMNRAVYQKKCFSENSKQELMNKIHKQERKKQLYSSVSNRFKQGLSVAVSMMFLGFLLGFIFNEMNETSPSSQSGNFAEEQLPVASLALITRAVELTKHDQNIINVTVDKKEHFIQLFFTFKKGLNEIDMREDIEKFLRDASFLSKDIEVNEELSNGIDVWFNYTISIHATDIVDTRRYEEITGDSSYSINGLKEKRSNEVKWLASNDDLPVEYK
jgi:hypothetical protein